MRLLGIIATAAALALPIAARGQTISYIQSSTAGDTTTPGSACGGYALSGYAASLEMLQSGAVTGTVSPAPSAGGYEGIAFTTPASDPGLSSWNAGDYVTSIEVTSPNSSVDWVATCIYTVNGPALYQIASDTTARTLGSAAIYSSVATSASWIVNSSTRLKVILVFANTKAHGGSQAVTINLGGAADTVATPLAMTAQNFSRSASDAVTVSDSAAHSMRLSRSGSDSAATSDGTSKNLGLQIGLSESASVSDSASAWASLLLAVSDSLLPSDSALFSAAYSRDALEVGSLSDAVGAASGISRASGDSISPVDSAVTAGSLKRLATESATVSDSAATASGILRAAGDSITPGDSAGLTASLRLVAAESAPVSDSISMVPAFVRALADSAAISESAGYKAHSGGHRGRRHVFVILP